MLLTLSVPLFLTLPLITLAGYTLEKVKVPSNLDGLQIFTDDSIAEFDGADASKPLLMGVKGVVFDVKAGKGFYHKGDSYNALTGKDSSRAVAKMSLEPEDLISDITGLSDDYLKSLDEIYNGVYLPKYPVVGYMDYLIEDTNPVPSKEDL